MSTNAITSLRPQPFPRCRIPLRAGDLALGTAQAPLARLARKGLAERKKLCRCSDDKTSLAYSPRHPWCRCKGSCRYRRTAAGRVVDATPEAKQLREAANR